MSFNGWTNRQTWNVSLIYEETFRSIIDERNITCTTQAANIFEAVVCELEFDGLKDGSLCQQAVGEYLDEVNWEEIAENYVNN